MPDSPASKGPLPTVFVESDRLSERLDARVILAVETFQRTGSFKFRAAYHVASHVPHEHLVASSSGNFGQALALAAKMSGKRCTVVMPQTAAPVKIEAVRSHGATVDLIDVSQVSRESRIAEIVEQTPGAYVASPFDDPLVIAGNASLGREIGRCGISFDSVVAPIGGGGLASGLAVGLGEVGASPRLYAAEPLMANDAARSFRAGHIVANEGEPPSVADGARTRQIGRHCWEILRHALHGVIEVPEEAIRQGVRELFSCANLKSEPTGALAVAALGTDPGSFSGQSVCCVVTGGNVDAAVYAALLADAS